MMTVKKWNAAQIQKKNLNSEAAEALRQRVARSAVLPKDGQLSEWERRKRHDKAVLALQTLRRYWHYLPSKKVRETVQNMVNDEPTFEDIDNKVLDTEDEQSSPAKRPRLQPRSGEELVPGWHAPAAETPPPSQPRFIDLVSPANLDVDEDDEDVDLHIYAKVHIWLERQSECCTAEYPQRLQAYMDSLRPGAAAEVGGA